MPADADLVISFKSLFSQRRAVPLELRLAALGVPGDADVLSDWAQVAGLRRPASLLAHPVEVPQIPGSGATEEGLGATPAP